MYTLQAALEAAKKECLVLGLRFDEQVFRVSLARGCAVDDVLAAAGIRSTFGMATAAVPFGRAELVSRLIP